MSQKLKVLLNIGTDHQEEFNIPLAEQDEVVTVDDRQADIMVNVLKVAKQHDATEEKEHEERVRKFDEEMMEQTIAAAVAREELEEKVRARMKKPAHHTSGEAQKK